MKRKVVLSSVLIDDPTYERKLIEGAGLNLVFVPNSDQERFLKEVVDTDAVITADKPITKEIIDSMKNCKVIVRQGIGYDTIDLISSKEKGIAVCNIPDYSIEEVSDFTLALMLTILRHTNVYDQHTRKGIWDIQSVHTVSGFPAMRRFSTQTLGIFGFGRIAKLVAKKARPFGFKIIATDPYVDPKVAEDMGVQLVDFDTVVRESDIMSINTPLTSETRHQFNIEVFKKMKPTAFIVNTGRGPLIKEDDLYEALKNKIIAGAAIDVTETEPLPVDNKLFTLDNLIISPHAAFFTSDSLEELRRRACEEVIRVLSGQEPENRVNK
ncbi:C-terminal binding protein [Tissierella carlieri]|uniref:C-terminal binding protein n=1 Tax=Tissierella carlieri TaxID=689904 RepID=A0ABT1S843_9FIRM|nr:C-terminal binding protein [Tissierella carlieri]MCQ4922644.1 C-terminal binding protein [Tissierella carlieri]MDU5082235.1 C-terminal binding protein [Bacillota bacterium]